MDNKTKWGLAAAGGVVVLAILFLSGGMKTKARRFDKEPQVSLVIDRETGERTTLPMEEYIKGVVAGEMGNLAAEGGEKEDWPHDAYASQAILARSFALNFLNDRGVVDISTEVTEAQAYEPDNISAAISDAVEATRGQVMTYQGDYVKAWFHSYSGGHTATAQEGLNYQGEAPFVRAVSLPENEYAPADHRSWDVAIPLATLTSTLKEKGVDVGDITDVTIAEKGPSGRAETMEIRGTEGTAQIHAAEMRLAIDPMELKSTLFDEFEVRGDSMHASGRGFGHGVGLSQWDAYKMAVEGKTARQIMETFFHRIDIEKVWD